MHLGTPSMAAPAKSPALGSPQMVESRNKVALTPGHSLMDWIRLGQKNADLAGTQGRQLIVSKEELAKHNTKDDAWTVLKGQVYNISPYMDFHPGGVEELLKGAGKDGTQLFNEIHKWVNFESMLEKCRVGKMETAPRRFYPKGLLNLLPPKTALHTVSGSNNSRRVSPVQQEPWYEWYQSGQDVTLVVYTRCDHVQHEDVVIDRAARCLVVTIHRLHAYSYTVHLELEHDVLSGYEVHALRPTGKVEVVIKKRTPGEKWTAIGKPLERNKRYVLTTDTDIEYRCCHLESVARVSHDTNLYCVTLPEGTRMCVPLGYHVQLKVKVEDMDVVRSYTVVRPSLAPGRQDPRVEAGAALYLMIKIYDSGALTPQLNKLTPGDPLLVSTHTGHFQLSWLQGCTHLILYAAGTGITPMLNLIMHTISSSSTSSSSQDNSGEQRHVHLSFFNKSQEDILWRAQLDQLAAGCESFTVRHILSQQYSEWTGPTGRVRKELMEDFIPPPGEGKKILFCACGPAEFTKEAIRLTQELGYTPDMTHAFTG